MWGYNEKFYGSINESKQKDGQREWLLKNLKESGHKLIRDTISTITKTNEFMKKFIDRTNRYRETH